MYEVVYIFVVVCVIDVHVLLEGQYHYVGGYERFTTCKCDYIDSKVWNNICWCEWVLSEI